MNPMTVLALVQGVLQGIPEALAVWQSVQAMVAAGQDPTAEDWAALQVQVAAAHQAVQGA